MYPFKAFALQALGKYNWAGDKTLKTKTAYLALGANIGDRLANLQKAVDMLNESGYCRVTKVSSVYSTKPVGLTDQPDFLNAVISVETTLSPTDLLKLCLGIEETLGRERTIRWGPRVIDIDILLYESVYINEDNLVIPHPRMMERAFVLVPLVEITPDIELAGGITAEMVLKKVDCSGVERTEQIINL